MNYKKLLCKLTIFCVTLLLAVALIVVVMDPFYHFHKPVLGMKAVLMDRDYQVGGTLDYFDYDSVILGTSIAENINTHEVDSLYDVTSIKAIRASGSNEDLMWYLNRAYSTHEDKKVFYAMSVEEFIAKPSVTIEDSDFYYLLDNNPFNDLEYIFNIDVLFKKIPLEIGDSFLFDYDEGYSYSWFQTKEFSSGAMTSHYSPPPVFMEEVDYSEEMANCSENIEHLKAMIASHPETEFYLYLSPNSALWWDMAYRSGELTGKFQVIEYIYNQLKDIPNVRMYNYMFDEDITFNLDLYMDTVHFSEKINSYIIADMTVEPVVLSDAEFSREMEAFKDRVISFSRGDITKYYPDAIIY